MVRKTLICALAVVAVSAFAQDYPQTAQDVGAINTSGTVSAVEFRNGVVNQTQLTISKAFTGLDGDGIESGGTALYDFPAGRIFVLGATADLDSTATAGVTGAYVLSLGTVKMATTNDTLVTTSADIIPSISCATGTVTATSALSSEAQFDGTTTAKDVWLNFALPAASSDNASTNTITVTGTATITWINLGDY